MNSKLHYGIIGLGPVGGTLMAHLAQAGAETTALVLEPERRQILKNSPLRVDGVLKARGRLTRIVDSIQALVAAKPDLILIATKSCNNDTLIEDLKRVNVPDSVGFVCCQNGLAIEEPFQSNFSGQPVLRMVMNFGCRQVGPDGIEVKFFKPHFLSKGSGRGVELASALAQDLNSQGYTVQILEDIASEVFKKVILNSSLGTVCSIMDMTMVAAMSSEPIQLIIKDLVLEGIRLGKALQLEIDEGFLPIAEQYFLSAGNHKPSMTVDIELGRPTENAQHCGALVRLADRTAVPVPVTKTIYLLMKELEMRAHRR